MLKFYIKENHGSRYILRSNKQQKIDLKLLSFFKGFVDMIGWIFQINAVEGANGTFQSFSG